jgi:uncharacterized membrane protein YqiK
MDRFLLLGFIEYLDPLAGIVCGFLFMLLFFQGKRVIRSAKRLGAAIRHYQRQRYLPPPDEGDDEELV